MRWTPVLLGIALLLAGCNAPSRGKGDAQDPFEDTPEAAVGKGLIRGIVVDPSLRPVAGATVSLATLEEATTSDEAGAFVFLDLEAGTYFVQVSKPGWTSVQQSADVVADLDEPPILKVAIERIPGAEPRALTLEQDGYLACSVGTPTDFYSCDTSGSENPDLYFDIEGTPRWVQTEIVWQSTQPSGDWFYVIQGFCSCEGDLPSFDNRFNETPEATSPHIARADPAFLAAVDVGSEEARQLLVSVSASGPEPDLTNGSGVALSQEFQVFATFFYNLDPDPAWTFVEDGPYPVPPG